MIERAYCQFISKASWTVGVLGTGHMQLAAFSAPGRKDFIICTCSAIISHISITCMNELPHWTVCVEPLTRALSFGFYFLPWNRYVALWNYSASFQGWHCAAEFLHLHSPRPAALSLCANNLYLQKIPMLSGGLRKKRRFKLLSVYKARFANMYTYYPSARPR